MLNEDAAAPLPRTLGRYRVLREIARGGMGSVLLARAEGAHGFSRAVVIKRMLAPLAASPLARGRFLDEARLMARMPHPHIAQVLDLLEQPDGEMFLVLEHIDGVSLAEARKRQALPLSLVAYIIARAAEGLHFAHELRDPHTAAPLGVVHRDVTPHNILLSRYGDVKLADFGVARSAQRETETVSGFIVGKPPYLSPEQVRGLEVDRRTDVFALGVTLYELLAGQRPFHGSGVDVMHAIARAVPPPPSLLNPDVPAALDEIVLAALAKVADERTPTALVLGRQLDDWLASEGARLGGAEVAAWVEALVGFESADDTASHARHEADAAAAPRTPFASASTALPSDKPLPRRASSFVGREQALLRVHRLFDDGAQIVTLLGPGGMGKTRTALAFAHELQGRVLFCDLTEASSLESLCEAVGDGLGISLPGGEEAAAQVGRALLARAPVFVVLDNFEQVAAHAQDTVGRWAQLSPDLKLLVTSRERLRLEGEAVFELPPLTLPSRGAPALDSEALRLFVDRAGSHGVSFAADELSDVAQLVKLLEGVPLAIELAAAASALFAPRELLDRFRLSYDVLEGGLPPGAPQRHASLRRTMEWSWQLLSDAERLAVAQCSCFRGGFSLDAAERVLDLSSLSDAPPVHGVVRGLLDKSLLFAEQGRAQERRFRMYVAVRGFATERFAELDPTGATLERHARYFLEVGAHCAAVIDSQEGPRVLRRTRLERGNLLAVHRRALRARPTTTASATTTLRAASALEPIMVAGGPLGAWLEILDETLAVADTPGVPATLASHIYEVRGLARYEAMRIAEGIDDCRRAVELAGDDDLAAGRAWRQLGLLCVEDNRLEEAGDALARALSLLRAAGDVAAEGTALANLGALAWARADLDGASELMEAGLALLERAGSRRLSGLMRGALAAVLVEHGRFDDGDAMFARAVEEIRAGGHARYEAIYLTGRGLLRLEQGHAAKALPCFESALSVARRLGEQRLEAIITALLGAAHAARGTLDDARRYFSSAEALASAPADAFAVALVRGALDVQEALEARALEDDRSAEAALENVHMKLEAAEATLMARADGLGAGAGIDSMSASLLRSIARILRRALDEVPPST